MNESAALADLIEDFRSELEAEVPLKLHQDSGESGAVFTPNVSRKTNGHPAAWTGLPYTAQFERYLGHSENYGFEFIAAASFDEIAAYCRSHHDESHAAGEATASTCRRLAVAVVELRQPLPFVAVQEDLSTFAVRKFLMEVLKHAENWRGKKRMRAAEHDSAEEPTSLDATLRIQHDEAREQRVWGLMRIRHPYLPDWEFERARRLEQHRKLGCRDCLAMAA